MDSLTQAALGAALGGAVLGRHLGRKSLLAGAVVGSLPDLDVLIDYGDAVANVTYHRGFSHSLFVLTGLSLVLAGLAQRLAERLAERRARRPAQGLGLSLSPAQGLGLQHLGLLRWWLFFWLCLVTHPLLDSLTTYGTQLWWPLEVTAPSATPLVFIIDPAYTLALLVALVIALWRGHRPATLQRAASWGLVISTLYLLLALGARGWVDARADEALDRVDIAEAPRLIQPAPFSILLWRVTAVDGDRHAETLIGLLDGDTRPVVELFRRGTELEAAALALDSGRRLAWFAGPFVRYEVERKGDAERLLATDLRLGFPGFHPFRFALAQHQDGDWRALEPTQQLPMSASQRPMGQLFERMLSPQPALCVADFVDSRWQLGAGDDCDAR
ncbi:hydrolase [Halomonas litopenaei]|uniref:Hydrolase n=1 Tax=Halomonas litopenaei TaxID=2109328 RepID=A0ABX5IVE3_9GAMM|nr:MULTISPECIES: metal-dependent hydrolase [Halomonas]MBS8268809.1 metal-dependent hydrolase [Halomonas litopenaei]PTL92096.1 hydrolase [Halomonas sp. SYSU XM8]PTL94557.1 hydrolase [Halomonas litopenaei]